MAASISSGPSRLGAEALFDSVGPAYERAFSKCTEQQDSIKWLIQNLPSNSTVLDIGCGTGRPVCSTLAAAGHSVYGVDISGAMIEAAKKQVPEADFLKVDIRTFAPPAGIKYDAITAYFSLISDVTQQEIKDTFMNIYSWLNPEGFFVFATVPISGDNLDIEWMGRPITVSSLSEEEILEALKGIGFSVLKAQSSKFMPEAVEAGICEEKDVWEEPQLFVYARK